MRISELLFAIILALGAWTVLFFILLFQGTEDWGDYVYVPLAIMWLWGVTVIIVRDGRN